MTEAIEMPKLTKAEQELFAKVRSAQATRNNLLRWSKATAEQKKANTVAATRARKNQKWNSEKFSV